MLVKIMSKDRTDYTLYSNVKDVYWKSISKETVFKEYSDWELGYIEDIEDNYVWRVSIIRNNTADQFLFVPFQCVYIMNDDGKTIDRV